MRNRILSVIGLTFLTIFIGRTASMTNHAAALVGPEAEQAALAGPGAPGAETGGQAGETHDEHADHDAATEYSEQAAEIEHDERHTDEASCLTSDIAELMEKRGHDLKSRESKIDEREAVLAALEIRLDEKLVAIEKTNAGLKSNVTYLQNIANQDMLHLVEMYQSMKPKQAAEIFNSMDPSFAAGFLREMNGQQAGMIMANMDARKSYAISVIIAARNVKYRKKAT